MRSWTFCIFLLLKYACSDEIQDTSDRRHGKQLFGLTNPFGILGHPPCVSQQLFGEESRIGECRNEIECATSSGSSVGGICKDFMGVCCVNTNRGECGQFTDSRIGYFHNPNWPQVENKSFTCEHSIRLLPGTCFVRLDFLTLELDDIEGRCVHDRATFIGGEEPSGNICGDRSSEVTLIKASKERTDVRISLQGQSGQARWNIGITQISCDEIAKQKAKMQAQEQARAGTDTECGKKNPSIRNKIGALDAKNKKKLTPALLRKQERKVKKVFEGLEDISHLSEFELAHLRSQRFRPMDGIRRFLPNNYLPETDMNRILSKILEGETELSINRRGDLQRQLGRILYGNETDINEYPWQISMMLDRSHFCGGSLISDEWIITAAHCADLFYRNHFKRVTISLGDHELAVYNETTNVFRKVKRIVRFPTYDENYLHGDFAMVQLQTPVPLSKNIHPVCIPTDDYDYAFRTAIITGWGYTEETKDLPYGKSRTSKILREAEQYVLPQDLCKKHSPFFISDRMVCVFKGPRGQESTCQGDSGGPLIVNNGTNKYVLIGATSFGVASCVGPYPSMFARISTFSDFISAAMVPNAMEYMQNYESPSSIIYD